jgi:hypothetical protein
MYSAQPQHWLLVEAFLRIIQLIALNEGVNLPAYLVIVKGTNQWRGGSRG